MLAWRPWDMRESVFAQRVRDLIGITVTPRFSCAFARFARLWQHDGRKPADAGP
jgi:hypothetical protein